jgi:hypothetical protein
MPKAMTRKDRAEFIINGYRSGKKPAQIARQLGMRKEQVSRLASDYRKAGFDVPMLQAGPPRFGHYNAEVAERKAEETKMHAVSGIWRGQRTTVYSVDVAAAWKAAAK